MNPKEMIQPMIGIVKELELIFAFGYDPLEFQGTLEAIADGALRVDPIITGVVGVDGVPAAFRALADPDDQVKILVDPGAPGRGPRSGPSTAGNQGERV